MAHPYSGVFSTAEVCALRERLAMLEALVRDTLKMHDDCLCRDRRKAFQAALQGARPLKHATWFDGGYLGNGHCSFMWARNGAGACCSLSHGHEGPHRDSQSEAALSGAGTAAEGEGK
jgi:hypothetical protein